MTEEKIKELNELCDRREVIKNELEAFDGIFGKDPKDLGYQIDSEGWHGKGCLHYIRDHHGYMIEALRKIYAEYKKELEEIQRKIDDFQVYKPKDEQIKCLQHLIGFVEDEWGDVDDEARELLDDLQRLKENT